MVTDRIHINGQNGANAEANFIYAIFVEILKASENGAFIFSELF
jgi:hypothetical protein